ncbi:hypothetical protein AB9F34_34565, partial [Rhizobium leguminosarum]|uniref:hypothetical protein n=1 Tax=Rhizobium leguminosarum TaxID=384 RepID=UPI003F960F59
GETNWSEKQELGAQSINTPQRPLKSPIAGAGGAGSASLSRIDRVAAYLNDDAVEAARRYCGSAKVTYAKTSASLPELGS